MTDPTKPDQTELDRQLAECDRAAVLEAEAAGVVLTACASCGQHVADDGSEKCPICEGVKA